MLSYFLAFPALFIGALCLVFPFFLWMQAELLRDGAKWIGIDKKKATLGNGFVAIFLSSAVGIVITGALGIFLPGFGVIPGLALSFLIEVVIIALVFSCNIGQAVVIWVYCVFLTLVIFGVIAALAGGALLLLNVNLS